MLAIGLIALAFNLRTGLASVGPLVGHIVGEGAMSLTQLGLLTTMPLTLFSALAM